MRKISPGIFLENKYPGVVVGAIVMGADVTLLDSPLRIEDGRQWFSTVSELGKPKYLVLLDTHPDRVLGARGLDVHILAHDWTRSELAGWSDTFKGGANPIGADADGLKRVTGLRKAVPEISFSDDLILNLWDRTIIFQHHPGPTPGSIWVVIPKSKVAFIGDSVSVAEPPYFGLADMEAWMTSLDVLRSSAFRGYKLVSSRDGLVDHDALNVMARFLRKVLHRIEKMGDDEQGLEHAGGYAAELLRGFKVPHHRESQALLRLQMSLRHLSVQTYPPAN